MDSERRKLRSVWREMFNRCYAPWHPSFHTYGGRGIGVALRWQAQNRTKIGRVMVDGEFVTFQDAARLVGIKPDTIRARLRLGWTLEKALRVKPSYSSRVRLQNSKEVA